MDKWITVRIKRPEDYEDVASEIVVEDFIQTARHGGWEYEIAKPLVVDSKDSLRDPNRYNPVGDERARLMYEDLQKPE